MTSSSSFNAVRFYMLDVGVQTLCLSPVCLCESFFSSVFPFVSGLTAVVKSKSSGYVENLTTTNSCVEAINSAIEILYSNFGIIISISIFYF